MRCDGIKLTPDTTLEEVNFDRVVTLSSMIREKVHESCWYMGWTCQTMHQ